MGIVIGLVNTKGGVGKSMLSSNIVAALNDSGRKAALLDAEEGGPTAAAINRFDETITTRCSTKLEEIDEEVTGLIDNHDVVVVDTPGKTGDAVSTICLIADLVLIPLQTSKRDLRQVRPVIKRMLLVQRQLGKPASFLVLNFTRKRDIAARIFREQLEPLGIEIAKTEIRRLDDYRDQDVVMRDMKGDRSDAARDIRALIAETIEPCLNLQIVANE